MTEKTVLDRIRGTLLGGAVGDALGAGIEFLGLAEIRQRFGPTGLKDYVPAYGRRGAITDDTQMSLFTAEGLIRAWVRMQERGICSVPGRNSSCLSALAPDPGRAAGGIRHRDRH